MMTPEEKRRFLEYNNKLGLDLNTLTSEETIDLRYLLRLWAQENGLDLQEGGVNWVCAG